MAGIGLSGEGAVERSSEYVKAYVELCEAVNKCAQQVDRVEQLVGPICGPAHEAEGKVGPKPEEIRPTRSQLTTDVMGLTDGVRSISRRLQHIINRIEL